MMKIGLPKAFLYYKYHTLWKDFFWELGQDVVVSPETNPGMLADGISHSIDESCLPAKVYMGHIQWLIGKCDRILVPRIENFGKGEKVCVKFNGIYDIVKNTYETELIDYNIDVIKGHDETGGFVKMGKALGFGRMRSLRAYKKAKHNQACSDDREKSEQLDLLRSSGKIKIMLVSHPYNIYDKLIGGPVAGYINKLGAEVIYADRLRGPDYSQIAKSVSPALYWTFNKELLAAVELYKRDVDGIVFITAFPCGPDSLINELILRKLKNIPVCNLIVDEQTAESGLHTRLESFLDIITERKKK